MCQVSEEAKQVEGRAQAAFSQHQQVRMSLSEGAAELL